MEETIKTENKTKYIFVTGGVLSGVGKGITAASIGAVLKAKGLKVSVEKCDPYLNVDAGLLNPAEHGECFVTKDGAETDLDLGHYERFLDIELTKASATLAGRLLSELIRDERAGKFHGKTVQLLPHLTNKIQEEILKCSKGSDVHIVEIGGTVGDYEGLSFVEAIREFASKVGRNNCLYIHVVYIPFLGTSKEFKTKPAQNAINDLRSFGITPDIIVCRSEEVMPEAVAEKISLFSGVNLKNIILMPNSKSVYLIPYNLAKSSLINTLSDFTKNYSEPKLDTWLKLHDMQAKDYKKRVKIGMVAKYLNNEDTYLSVTEALKAAGWDNNVGVDIKWINAETASEKDLKDVDGILVPGGFGGRGVEGKIFASSYALKHKKPYLGICLGLQTAIIAASRLGGINGQSREFSSDGEPVVYLMSGQEGKESTGGTMRLGDYPAKLIKNTKILDIYKSDEVIERHRHRYEVNQKYEDVINKGGVIFSGFSPDKKLVEFIESKNKDQFFVATQAHPEFKSRPQRPHPLFKEFIRACR